MYLCKPPALFRFPYPNPKRQLLRLLRFPLLDHSLSLLSTDTAFVDVCLYLSLVLLRTQLSPAIHVSPSVVYKGNCEKFPSFALLLPLIVRTLPPSPSNSFELPYTQLKIFRPFRTVIFHFFNRFPRLESTSKVALPQKLLLQHIFPP